MHTITWTASHCKVVIDLFEAWSAVIGVLSPGPLVAHLWTCTHCSLPKVYQELHLTTDAAMAPCAAVL